MAPTGFKVCASTTVVSTGGTAFVNRTRLQGVTMNYLKTLISKIDWTTLGGRRFVLCLGAGAVTSVLQYTGHLPADGLVYRDIVLGTIGVYVAGNVTQKIEAPIA